MFADEVAFWKKAAAPVLLTTHSAQESPGRVATRRGISHRLTPFHHPEGNSYIKRFYRRLKKVEV